MIDDYRFFQDFFDGQLEYRENEKFKLFKLMLVSIASAVGLFLVLYGICNWAELLLLVFGLIWNVFSGLSRKSSLVLGVLVGVIYFFFAVNFAVYANAMVYVGCYIPFQLIASSAKDFEDGDFVQVRKKITDLNKILFVIFFAVLCVIFALFGANIGGRFIIFDSLSASLLVCSALLRNERYSEYYIFRIFALVSSIILWSAILVEYGATGTVAIIIMYVSYLIFDVVNYFYQTRTYKNEYMLVQESYVKESNGKLVKEKLKLYIESEKSKTKNK